MEINNEKEINLKQMSRIAIIVSVALVLMLIIGIIISNVTGIKQIKDSTNVEFGSVAELSLNAKDFFDVKNDIAAKITFDTSKVDLNKVGEYEAYAKYNNKQYTIKVVVEDTTAPKVTMENRYIFTNDIAALNDFTSMVKEVSDASEYTLKLVRFEQKKELVEVNDLELKNLTEGTASLMNEEAALAVGSDAVPTDAGIYRSVLEVKDAQGNASYEEVVVILDTTGALITDVADQVVKVSKDKLNEQPEIDKSLYSAVDNVDGYIKGDSLSYEVSCRDEAKHEWVVKVSYTDRAGNESLGEFLITLKEKQKATSNKNNNSGKENTGNKNTDNNNTNSSDDKTYDPADTNKDGVVSTDEGMRYITPEKQACIDAGYGVVCEFDGGTWYAVLMKYGDYTIDGKDGHDILREYLDARDLDGHIGGCWINSDNEWYWFIADEIREKITEEDEGFWS